MAVLGDAHTPLPFCSCRCRTGPSLSKVAVAGPPQKLHAPTQAWMGPDTVARVQLLQNGTELQGIRKLMRVTDPHNLGRGRDVKEKDTYDDLEVVHAWKIHKPVKAKIYEAKKSEALGEINAIRGAGGGVRPTSTALDLAASEAHLDERVNEHLLLTGTKAELVTSILQNGVDPRFCNGLFGAGAYFAENAAKIDQYCTADEGSVTDIHSELYTDCGLSHPGKVFYCFVARVIIGAAVHTKDGETDLSTSQSIWGTSDKRVLTTAPGTSPPVHYHTLVAETGEKILRHREFIIFDRDRAKLEYLIAFKRVKR